MISTPEAQQTSGPMASLLYLLCAARTEAVNSKVQKMITSNFNTLAAISHACEEKVYFKAEMQLKYKDLKYKIKR